MKNLINNLFYAVCLLLIAFASLSAQSREIIKQDDQKIDINSKANELGITSDQLQGIIHSAAGNVGNEPLPEALQERFLTGAAAGDNFGSSVSTAGDVNGDGYDDIIVGAYFNDAGGNDAGRAYIYYGGNIFNNIADVTLTGEAADDYFGISVFTAGDVNGDGYDDIIIGALYNDAGGNNAGRAYIYFGDVSMNDVADVILTGEAADDNFGFSVSTTGDVNGDGYSDVIVGALYNDTGGNNAGRAYIYFGGSDMDNIADINLTGEAADDWFGYSVSTAGDTNGDGYSDVIVGASRNDAGGSNTGRAYIFFGGSGMDNIADVTLTGDAAQDNFGSSISIAGDVNGDGYIDVIVGAQGNDAGGDGAGRAYIYYGGFSMDTAVDVTLTGAAAGDLFGISVSTAGDVNGDGYSDVIVGAYGNDAGGSDAGRAYIYLGGASMDEIVDLILTGKAADDLFGSSVSAAGDVNGDGYSDVIVGAFLNDEGGSDAGRAYIYTNFLTGTDIPDEFFTGELAGDHFGYSVSTAGDVNGDGFSDIIVGAYYNAAGRAYIYFSGPGMDNTADVTMTGEVDNDNFGFSVSEAGDVNGDGFSDVIIGAYLNDAGGSYAGRAYIYFGGPAMDNTADVIMTGEAADDWFGYSVSTAGDVNGDGYSDVIVGARTIIVFGSYAGRAYIYFGGSGMDNTANVIMTGEELDDHFGWSVSTAGDVNGDGYSDIIVGANWNDAGGFDAGRAYIYFGGTLMDNTADVIMTGEADNDNFGVSVSTARDVNGDGYSDIIVGAYRYVAVGSYVGRAYIYFGGTLMDNTADVIMTGEAAIDHFGYSVSTAGDANGDGYSDVIVGASHNDAGGSNAGRAYIYFGGTLMDNTADVIMTGEAADDWFGYSVSTAGDVNGDGYSDNIVGAYLNDAGGADAGRAYLYLSSSPPIKPPLKSVKDISFDQGGFVRVRWNRSGYDIPGQNRIAEYIVQRSDPPGMSGFVWDYVATIPALREPEYSFVAPTPSDSSLNTSGTFYFRVIARGTNPDEMWYSNIMSGHSIDNLSPQPPLNFYANLSGSDVHLGWKANTEPDFKNYLLFRTDDPGANPDTLEIFAEVFDTTFTDTNPLSGTTYYYLKAQDIHNNLSQYVLETISSQSTFALSVSVNNGWNMVSVPGLHPTNQNVETWWSGKDPAAGVFKYAGGYVPITSTSPSEGYWMKNSGAQVYNYAGIQVVPHNPINASAGWNLIGGYELSVQTANITTLPSGLVEGSVFEYSGGYNVATNLVPGYGYWIKLSGAGQIIVPEVFAKGEEPVEYFPESWGKIILTDASGINYTLYAVNGEVNLDNYELPPMPPAGMFDIRYGSGRIAEDINSSMQTIEMSGVEYPLTVRAEGVDIRVMDESGKTVNVNLKSGEDVVINDATIQKLMVTGELIPAEYALEQNYPNPFNPSTTIEFSLPEDVSNVKLSIYNALGEKVAELVNTNLVAGKYQYQWNAKNVATGMYIYELRINKFVSVKKMILLK